MEYLKDLEKRSSVVTDKDKEIIKNMHEIVVENALKKWLEDSFFKIIQKDFNKHEFIQPNDEIFDNPLLNDLFHDSLLRGMFAVMNWVQTHQQEVYNEFFAPSLIATEILDKDWGEPIPCSEVDDVFLKFNPRKHTILNDSKG